MLRRISSSIGMTLARYLSAPVANYRPLTTSSPKQLASTLRPGDVLLVEGNTRISNAIKYLTQSTWSHAALYVGAIPNADGNGGGGPPPGVGGASAGGAGAAAGPEAARPPPV